LGETVISVKEESDRIIGALDLLWFCRKYSRKP